MEIMEIIFYGVIATIFVGAVLLNIFSNKMINSIFKRKTNKNNPENVFEFDEKFDKSFKK